MMPENAFVFGYLLGGIMTWLICYEYMRKFKVDRVIKFAKKGVGAE